MNIKLYQVNMDRDEDSAAFLSLDNLRHTHPNAEVEPAIYDLVYSGEVNCKDLEEVFHLFNFDHSQLCRGGFQPGEDPQRYLCNGKGI